MTPVRRIRDRKLVQWLVAYLAAAWLVLQVSATLAEAFGWPPGFMRAVPVLLVVGLLAAGVLAWYHGEKGAQRISTIEVLMLCGIFIIAGAAVTFVDGARGDAPGPAGPAPGLPATIEQASIAVLPFADMSAARDQEYFADGLTEELLNVLAQIPELRVAARTSSFAFKGRSVAVDSIARALRVAYVLEGSLRTDEGQIRVTAQLIDASTGYHVWSDSYDRRLEDIFRIQDEISHAIVDALEVEITGRDGRPLAITETEDAEAHSLVLKGFHALRRQSTREAIDQALAYFRQAIARDSTYARAHAGLAGTHFVRGYRYFDDPAVAYPLGRQSAERALALDPASVEALLAIARLNEAQRWDFEAAEAYNRRALALNPGMADIYDQRAWLLIRLDRPDEAIAAARRAAVLDPVSISAFNTLGAIYSYTGRNEEAIAASREALKLAPGHPILLGNLALTLSDLGRHDDAIRVADEALADADDEAFLFSTAGYVYGMAGHRDVALRHLRDLNALPNVSPYLRATVHAGLGDADRVFEALDQALDQRDHAIIDLAFDPVFGPFQTDPRMGTLLERVKDG